LVLVMLVAALTVAVEISAQSDLQTDLQSLELSPAASAESQEDEGEGGVLGRCGEECAGAARQEQAGQGDESSCRAGCRVQQQSQARLQAAHPDTEASRLRGAALDLCWTECGAAAACRAGCTFLQRLQSQQEKQKQQVEQDFIERLKSQNDEMEENEEQEDQGTVMEDMPGVVRTYVLWHPLPGQLSRLMDSLVWRGGWRDDTNQIQIVLPRSLARISEPQPLAEARTEEEKFDEVYSRLASTVEEARTKLERVIVSPQFKEALYYILLVICIAMMATSLHDNFVCKRRRDGPQEMEDLYYLADTAVKARLPSYEECCNAEKPLTVNLQEEKATSA